jgi:two-component system CitB family sensor kinase
VATGSCDLGHTGLVRRTLPLRSQLLLLQLAIVVVTVAVVGLVAAMMQSEQIRDSYRQQLVGVAQSVATLPTVREAFGTPDPAATIQPIAELIRQSSGVTYVVVTDDHGIRFSHPDPDRIGEPVSTDPGDVLEGETFVGTQTGTLGRSWRVKVPIRDDDGTVIGMVSVGILEAELREDLVDALPVLMAWLVGAAAVGTLGAFTVSRLVWRRIYRLEPEQIASLLEARDAMLHGIGEGVVAVDDHDRVALVNDEAARLLGLGDDVIGRPADEVLEPDARELLRRQEGTGQLLLAGERILLARSTPATIDGRPVGVVLILRDRTELHATLRDLEGARDLTKALRAQAHEFSNRMHVVSGLIELGRTDEAVAFIERSGHGGALDRRRGMPGIADPDVVALLLAKTTTSEERGVELAVTSGAVAHPDGTTDLVTVLGNLVDNAVDVSAPGDRVEVTLVEDEDGTCVVRVCDEGPGVSPEDRDRIFAPGVSTKHTASSARGIGLALVQRIVTRRGGTVSVGDAASGGACFEARLPPARGTASTAATRPARIGGGRP